VRGFKTLKLQNTVIQKPMHAFVIRVNGKSIGYIQYYNKHDFPPEQGYNTFSLPDSCGAMDLYIGEKEFCGKGIGTQTISLFLKQHVLKKFDYVFVDPDTKNFNAINAYSKAGFSIKKQVNASHVTWMLRSKA
jgi:aminoglycoside 6'-N-acetyltransferase